MRGGDIAVCFRISCIKYNLPHPFKNKKAAPPRSISERSEQPCLSASAVYDNFTEVSSAHFG